MNRNLTILALTFLVFVPLQILVFEHLALFNTGFCFIYVIFLLLLPIELGYIQAMLVALLVGLLVDIFDGTLGIHAASSVFLMFLRPYWLRAVTPRGGYEVNTLPCIGDYGLTWFSIYAAPLVLMHSLAVFFIEAAGSGLFWLTLSKVALTSVISLVFMVTIQYLFYPKRKT